jgi:8-oxo-dGTP pyrophosphatase MutT (NUDIX family)
VRSGGPAPWSDLPARRRHLTLDLIRRSLADAGPGAKSAVERLGVRASAVLAPLYEHEGEVHVVLTRRAQHLRSHRGEVSFPGGGQDESDETLAHTALREAYEETGLDGSTVEIVGELDHLTTISSRSYIVPFVGVLPARPDLVANPAEVDTIIHLPIDELLDPEIYREERWGLPGLERPIYFFEIVGDTIWGATAAMLRNLLRLTTGT